MWARPGDPTLPKPEPSKSPIQPSKRRRLDNASHALSKPFKSPFKTPLKAKTDTETNSLAPSSSPVKDDQKSTIPQSPTSSPPEAYSAPTAIPLRRSLPLSHSPASAETLTLQKKHTHLLNQLSATRASLETSNQALKVETSDRDTELEALIVKWRVASRAAAEEVFAGARDKVNKMGGVGAMRDREKSKNETAWGWEDTPKKESDDDEGGHEEDEDGFHIGEDEGEEQDEREEGAKKDAIYGDDDEGYTMDMMLKTLNIELKIIGYDKGLQKWVD
jgi:Swi5-dependent recombination DNA repair protein 1